MENVRAIRRARRTAGREFIRTAGEYAAYFIGGALLSRGAVLTTLAPFGASLAAAAPIKRLIPSLLGAAFGYILLAPTDSFRYIAVLAAIGGARWLFSGLPKLSQSRLFAPLTAFLPILGTGIALLFGRAGTMSEFSACLTEALLAAAAAYFFSVTLKLTESRRGLGAFTKPENACLVITGCLILLSLGSVGIDDVSLGRFLAVIAVLCCAQSGGVFGGAVSGVSTGAVFSLAGSSQGFLCGSYALGGLMAGLFSGAGKLGAALAFAASDFIMTLAFGGRLTAAVFIEGAAGAAVFMLLPRSVFDFLAPVFADSGVSLAGERLRDSAVARLDYVARAIRNVRGDVEKVSLKLDEMYSPGFESVCEIAAKEVCSGCGLRMYCYDHEKGVTHDDFCRMEEVLSARGSADGNDIENTFIKKCCKKDELAKSMTRAYRQLLQSKEAASRVAEIRGVIAGQFSGVGDILDDLARELGERTTVDTQTAERVTAALEEVGLTVGDCVCLLRDDGNLRVELVFDAQNRDRLKKGGIARLVSRCCSRRFDLPTFSEDCGKIRVTLCEMPCFDVEIGTDQHIAKGGKLCGDSFDYFNDGAGNTCALICDGMGTGGRAAVDSEMAVSVMGRLLRAGLSGDSSLQIVNTALMVKSGDESLSTVDLTSVDLYSGKVTLSKAGAPMTFIKKNGRVSSRELRSLPAGILGDIRFATETVKLSAGDMVIMVSDGVVTGDEKWLEQLIKTWNRGSAQELAQAVVEEAIRRREESKDDDITAVALRLVENE